MHESEHRPSPARPHRSFTDDGLRVAEVLSYSRRGSRFNPRQAKAWEQLRSDWVIEEEWLDARGFSWASHFGRDAPLVVEIGSGIGEATVALAAARPDHDVLALEVWRPGVADTLARIGEAGLHNVRLCGVDAAWTIEHRMAPGSLAELWTFFPDPWHKVRHHKRRLVSSGFAQVVAERLRPGGRWRLATDWPQYASHMVEVLDAQPLLEGGVVERWAERPLTKFERRGLAEGRPPVDLTYTRV